MLHIMETLSLSDVLNQLNFGQRVAEDEVDVLESYFVETDHWRKIAADEVDIIYGPKGSGKSALYFLLTKRADSFFDKNIGSSPGN